MPGDQQLGVGRRAASAEPTANSARRRTASAGGRRCRRSGRPRSAAPRTGCRTRSPSTASSAIEVPNSAWISAARRRSPPSAAGRSRRPRPSPPGSRCARGTSRADPIADSRPASRVGPRLSFPLAPLNAQPSQAHDRGFDRGLLALAAPRRARPSRRIRRKRAARRSARHPLGDLRRQQLGGDRRRDPAARRLPADRADQHHSRHRRADGRDPADPVRLGYFLAIRELVGEGNDQYVDDMYSTNDGRLLIVSRPSLADVVAIDIASGEDRLALRRRRPALRPHGDLARRPARRRLGLDRQRRPHPRHPAPAQEVGRFASGDSPHENTYSADGERIYHAIIGLVYTPADDPHGRHDARASATSRSSTRRRNEILERVDMGQKLAEAGYPNMSSAVRPMAISPDENARLLPGLVLPRLRRVRPQAATASPGSSTCRSPTRSRTMPREQYLLDSAHHGIAMNGDGNAALRRRDDVRLRGDRLRARTSRYKLIEARREAVLVDDQRQRPALLRLLERHRQRSRSSPTQTRKEIARIPVGDHPQRIRMGCVRTDWIRSLR